MNNRKLSIPSIIIENDEELEATEGSDESPTRSSIGSFESDSSENGFKERSVRGSFSSEAKRFTARASQMIIHVPIEHLKKIAHTKSIGSLSRETEHFVGITTVHGPLRVYRGKGIGRWLWAGVLILCIVVFFIQFGLTLQMFTSKPTVSQVTYLLPDDGLTFPSVTICSYNPVRRSYIQTLNQTGEFSAQLLDYLLLSFLEVQFVLSINNQSGLAQGQADLEYYVKNVDPSFKINEFFLQAGPLCNETLILCSFGGRTFDCCNHSRPILTDMGKCFRIDLAASPEPWMHQQVQASVNNGLQIIADFHQEEQIDERMIEDFDITPLDPLFSNEFEDGFRFYVHSPETVPYLSTEGISVSPGTRIYSAISPSRFTLLDVNSWGNCSDKWPKGFHKDTAYSSSKCKAVCRAKFFYENCGCSPLVYNLDGEYPVCSAYQLAKCLNNQLLSNAKDKESAQSILPQCIECLVECDRWIYYSYNSYSIGFSRAALSWFKQQNSRWTASHVSANFITMNIFFRDLSYTEYQQLKSTNLVTTLSNIGGNMGMFLGMSLLSVIEVIIYFYKSSWIFISKKRRQHMVEKKEREKERERVLEETIKAAEMKSEAEEEKNIAERTFNRMRKFATAIRDRSMSVIYPNYYQDPTMGTKKTVDIETNGQIQPPQKGPEPEPFKSLEPKISTIEIPTSGEPLKRKVTFIEATTGIRKTTLTDPNPNEYRSRRKSVVENIMNKKLFGSGAADIEKDEPEETPQVIELKIDLNQLLEEATTSTDFPALQRRRSRSFDGPEFDPVLVNSSEAPQRSYSVAGLNTKPKSILGEYKPKKIRKTSAPPRTNHTVVEIEKEGSKETLKNEEANTLRKTSAPPRTSATEVENEELKETPKNEGIIEHKEAENEKTNTTEAPHALHHAFSVVEEPHPLTGKKGNHLRIPNSYQHYYEY